MFVAPTTTAGVGLADPAAEIHAVSRQRYFREPVSGPSHARDVFAPVAAHLALGESLAAFGPRIGDPVRLGGQKRGRWRAG